MIGHQVYMGSSPGLSPLMIANVEGDQRVPFLGYFGTTFFSNEVICNYINYFGNNVKILDNAFFDLE